MTNRIDKVKVWFFIMLAVNVVAAAGCIYILGEKGII